MNCNRYQYEMSMSLDGRLPSGRREALLTHIDACTACAGLWDEMRHAQGLVLSLPPESVNNEFQDTLWDRIRAGEGSPDAVFNDPVPILTRVRYVMTGAAAAALVILSIQLFGRDDSPSIEDSQVVRHDGSANNQTGGIGQVAQNETTRGTPLFPQHENTAQPLNRSIRVFTPHNVAELGAQLCVSRVNDLQRRIPQLEDRLASSSVRQVRDELRVPLSDLRSTADLMGWMERDQIIRLPPEFKATIKLISRHVRSIESAKNSDDMLVALAGIRSVRTDELRMKFGVSECCEEPQLFFRLFQSHFGLNPHVGGVLKLQVIRPSISSGSYAFMLDTKTGSASGGFQFKGTNVEVEFDQGTGRTKTKSGVIILNQK